MSIPEHTMSIRKMVDAKNVFWVPDHAEGQFWILEANTLPGMTPTSLLPFAASAVGIEYGELCEKMVCLALEK